MHWQCRSHSGTLHCSNILKEPLLVHKQTIAQMKALILSFLGTESLRAWHYQEGVPARHKSFFRAGGCGVIFKLSIRAFFWGIDCFSTSIGSFNFELKDFPNSTFKPCMLTMFLSQYSQQYTANTYSGKTVEVQWNHCDFEKIQWFTTHHASLYFLPLKIVILALFYM